MLLKIFTSSENFFSGEKNLYCLYDIYKQVIFFIIFILFFPAFRVKVGFFA